MSPSLDADNDTPRTLQLLGVLGHPITHSLSPRMHNAALQAQGIAAVYLPFDVPPERLPAAIQGVRSLRMPGVNITVPHKISVVALLDEIDSTAARVGAVNTIVREADRLVGHNTDVAGFTAALQRLMPEGVQGSSCVLLGAGGAARAVLAALIDQGAAEVHIYNRTPEIAERLAETAASWGKTRCLPLSLGELSTVAREAALIVNATPVGMEGMVKETPLPVDILHSRHVVMDVVYGKRPTPLVEQALARGARAADGREMLLMQAAAAYELWTKRHPPLDVMRRSLEQEERRGPDNAGRARGTVGAQAGRETDRRDTGRDGGAHSGTSGTGHR
jgi:shikimate dehydrogenase